MVAEEVELLASDIFAAASVPVSSLDSENGRGPAGYPDGAGASVDRARGKAPHPTSGAQWAVHLCVESYRRLSSRALLCELIQKLNSTLVNPQHPSTLIPG